MPPPKKSAPTPEEVRAGRSAAGMTQTEAAETVHVSMRAWQQWEGGERTMPPGLFELFMIKTGHWPVDSGSDGDGN
ncbi:MAG TPA: helix-turn-helix domain-containing protein [Lysobacter sp.]